MSDATELPTDSECAEFLRELDDADFDVTDFEATFIGSNYTRAVFTDRQRATILQMMDRYRSRLR